MTLVAEGLIDYFNNCNFSQPK